MRKPSQLLLKISVIVSIAVLAVTFYSHNKKLLLVWLIALAAGFILYRSGICFSGAFTDIVLFKDFTMARTLLIILMVSLAGISAFQYYYIGHGQPPPGRLASFGIHTAVGAFLFGLGMVFAGACGCGTLQKLGEASFLHVFVLTGLFIGSIVGAYHFSWWSTNFIKSDPVYLPKIFGWPWGVLLSLSLLGLLYFLTFIGENSPSSFQKGWGKWQKKG